MIHFQIECANFTSLYKPLKIFVCPLNWGLGHATRTSVVISALLNRGHEVVIGADGKVLTFLQNEFPKLKCIRVKDIDVSYANTAFLSVVNYMRIAFSVFSNRRKEHQLLQEIQTTEKFDVIISDNRYGLYLQDVHSILITHQTQVKTPFLSHFINSQLQKWLTKFNEVWVPDFEGSVLSGELSNGSLKQKKYVGILSRFTYDENSTEVYDCLYLLSGPEPQRTALEKNLSQIIRTHPYPSQEGNKNLPLTLSRGVEKCVVVRGTKKASKISFPSNVKVIDFATTEELQHLLNSSKHIVCRGGYSTIMDLVAVKKSALLIPTPNQWEQEYLAKYLSEKNYFSVTSQNNIELHFSNTMLLNFPENNLLEKAIDELETKLLKV
ncbi:MAG: glycosyltransferase family protein [Bacteroidia bacterium]